MLRRLLTKSLRVGLSVVLLLGASFGSAETAPLRLPQARPPMGSFQLTVTLGDRETRFQVWRQPEGMYFSAESNDGISKKGSLSQKNYDFLIRKLSEIQPLRDFPARTCPRMNISLQWNGEKKDKTACLHLKNPTTEKMRDLANLLSVLLH